MRAPITVFAYARLEHLRRTIEALLSNTGASEHDLIVYSDAPRKVDNAKAVLAVRSYLETIQGFRSVTVHHRPHNYGLARSIIEGVTEVLSQYERIIVLEDDMITSKYFLTYMNEALEQYAECERIVSIHGYIYPVRQAMPEAFFLRGADCWGWATWRRGWAIFNPNGQELLRELKRRNLINAFNFNGTYRYSQMLESQINGTNDSWAIRWYASAFLANKLTLYPGRSLVHNIGNDGSGTHCGLTTAMDTELVNRRIDLNGLMVEEHSDAKKAIEDYFQFKTPRFNRVVSQMYHKDFLRKVSRLSKNWLPPAIDRRLRTLINPDSAIRFEGNYRTWDEASALCTGYNTASILDKVFESTMRVKMGEAAFERDSVNFDEIHYSWPVTAATMWAAAKNKGELHVLDFGGSLGSSYFQNRRFLSQLDVVSWHVVEQEKFVEKGKQFIENDVLKFYFTIEDAVKSMPPNVILLGSVLQYLANLDELLEKFNNIHADILIVDRTPITNKDANTLCIQHVPDKIYKAEYPMWLISEKILISKLSNWRIHERFACLEGERLGENDQPINFSGIIFQRINR